MEKTTLTTLEAEEQQVWRYTFATHSTILHGTWATVEPTVRRWLAKEAEAELAEAVERVRAEGGLVIEADCTANATSVVLAERTMTTWTVRNGCR